MRSKDRQPPPRRMRHDSKMQGLRKLQCMTGEYAVKMWGSVQKFYYMMFLMTRLTPQIRTCAYYVSVLLRCSEARDANEPIG